MGLMGKGKTLDLSLCGYEETSCQDSQDSVANLTTVFTKVEEMSIDSLVKEVNEIPVTRGEMTERNSFEMYLICILQLKRVATMSPRTQNKELSAFAIGLEIQAFFEYFPAISIQEKVDVASNILRENIFFELEPHTMVALIETGIQVEDTKISYNLGLQVWQGTWLHYLATKETLLQRRWFPSSEATCFHRNSHESILDQVLNSDIRNDVKYFNIALCLAMGCEPLNLEVDGEAIQLLSAAARQVYLTEEM